jgi:hypothetical protein
VAPATAPERRPGTSQNVRPPAGRPPGRQPAAEAAPAEPVDERADRLLALVRRVEAGDLSLLPALRKGLDENPALWRSNGDLANTVVHRWVDAISGPNEVHKECVRRKLRELWRELAGDRARPLERLLLDRVVACWLAVHHAELLNLHGLEGQQSFKMAEYRQGCVGRAQKRYLAAIRALAQYRRLLGPAAAVQVNVAEQQINVAGAAGG